MPGIVLIGAQWGDEGKGKATDLIGTKVDYVARFNGGNNAGHTVVVGDESYALHLLPSGIISPTATPVIGNGVVVDPEVLFEEIDGLESRGVDCSRLLVSEGAHIIAPYHRVLDKVTERFLGKHKIGTTGRGIGPAYADKINRVGIRVHDLFNAEHLHDKVEASLHQKNQMLVKLYNRRPIDVNETTDELLKLGERLKPYVPTPRWCSIRHLTKARPCCSKAARPLCSTWITAHIRLSRPPTRLPAAHAPVPVSARPRSPA